MTKCFFHLFHVLFVISVDALHGWEQVPPLECSQGTSCHALHSSPAVAAFLASQWCSKQASKAKSNLKFGINNNWGSFLALRKMHTNILPHVTARNCFFFFKRSTWRDKNFGNTQDIMVKVENYRSSTINLQVFMGLLMRAKLHSQFFNVNNLFTIFTLNFRMSSAISPYPASFGKQLFLDTSQHLFSNALFFHGGTSLPMFALSNINL